METIKVYVVQHRRVSVAGENENEWRAISEWPGGKRAGILLDRDEAENLKGCWDGREDMFSKFEARVLEGSLPMFLVP